MKDKSGVIKTKYDYCTSNTLFDLAKNVGGLNIKELEPWFVQLLLQTMFGIKIHLTLISLNLFILKLKRILQSLILNQENWKENRHGYDLL